MRKFKSFVYALIAALAATCCFALVACGGNTDPPGVTPEQYTVVWTVGDHATVTAAGYDALPQKLAKGTEVTFSVATDEGWQVVSVAGTPASVIKNADGTYKFTATANTAVVVLTAPDIVIPPVVETTYDVTWDVDEHATVTATGYETLPETLTVGTPVVFSVEVDEGWEIDSVGPANAVTKIGDNYSFTVAGDITITVTTKEASEVPPPAEKTMYEITEISCEYENSTFTYDDCTMPMTYMYFAIKGRFVDATSLYVKFVSAHYHTDYVLSDTVTRTADSDEFEVRFNTFRMVQRLGYDLEVGGMNSSGMLCYVDIYATDADGEETTERLKTADYESVLTNVDKEITYGILNYSYDINVTLNGGINKDCIKLDMWKSMRENYYLVGGVIEDGGKPYLVFSGEYYLSYDRTEALADLENFVDDICVFNDWDNKADFTQEVTLNDNFSFTLTISLENLEADKIYVMHANMDYKASGEDKNLHFGGMFGHPVTVGDKTYDLILHDTGWGWNWSAIQVMSEYDPAKTMLLTGTSVKVVGGKPYFTVTYYYEGYTQAEIEALPVNFDLQVNDNINGGGWTRYFFDDKISFAVDAANDTFDVRIDISGLRVLHGFTVHYSLDKEAGDRVEDVNNPKDFKPAIDRFDEKSAVCGDLTYKLVYKKGSGEGNEYWGCVGLQIVNTPGYKLEANATVQLAEENGKMYVVITGACEGYTLDEIKAKITVDYQDPDHGWATTAFTAEQLVITIDAAAKTFTVKADITGVANGQYLLHFNGSDIGNESGIAAIALGGKTYAYVFRDFDGWTRYVLTIADASEE